jgi:hypothetical protein
MGGISLLVQSIWSSVGLLYAYGNLFLLVRGVFFYNLVEDIYWPFLVGNLHSLLYLLSLGFVFSLFPRFPGCFVLESVCLLQFL